MTRRLGVWKLIFFWHVFVVTVWSPLRRLKSAQEAPRDAQEAPRDAQEVPRGPKRVPKSWKIEPNTLPKCKKSKTQEALFLRASALKALVHSASVEFQNAATRVKVGALAPTLTSSSQFQEGALAPLGIWESGTLRLLDSGTLGFWISSKEGALAPSWRLVYIYIYIYVY